MSELAAIRSGMRNLLVTSVVPIVAPSGATITITAAASTSYGRGSWVQASSSGRLTNHSITALALRQSGVTEFEIDIGSGAVGSEVVRGTVTAPSGTALQAGNLILMIPAIRIPANERLAFRIGSASTNGPSAFIKATAIPEPI